MSSAEKTNSVLGVFDSIANEYVEYFGEDWEFINEIQEFAAQLPEKAKVLDLGCGSGYITNYLHNQNLNAVGLDFSQEMINIAKEKYPTIDFLLADFVSIQNYFDENSVDALIAVYSLYFVPKEQFESVLKSLSKVLKNDGKFFFVTQIGNGEDYITTPLMEENNVNEKLYVNYYNKDELETILNKCNFEIEYLKAKYDYDEKEISNSGRYIVLAKNKKM